MQTLKTSEAAALLNVSPNTLRAWERRFGFPRPERSPGRHRLYPMAEIAALRAALEGGRPISSAVSVASDETAANELGLFTALTSFRCDRADAAMEGALAIRTLERALEETLLPALDHIRNRKGPRSACWAFASAWANSWLERTGRIVVRETSSARVLIGDAADAHLDASAPYMHALALCCRCAGATVLITPVRAVDRLHELVAAFVPTVVVIAGGWASDHEVATWAYALHATAEDLPFLLYLRGFDHSVAGARRQILPAKPGAACRVIMEGTPDHPLGPRSSSSTSLRSGGSSSSASTTARAVLRPDRTTIS